MIQLESELVSDSSCSMISLDETMNYNKTPRMAKLAMKAIRHSPELYTFDYVTAMIHEYRICRDSIGSSLGEEMYRQNVVTQGEYLFSNCFQHRKCCLKSVLKH